MTPLTKPQLVYHADWGSKPSKRWCAKAIFGLDGLYTDLGRRSDNNILALMTTDKILAEIDAEIARLSQVRALLSTNGFGKDAPFPIRTRRKMSKAARAKIAAAQRKRWAKQKATK
jgi:hypothetical protein